MSKKISGQLTVTFADDVKIRSLNKKYFNRDYPTDVLSFELSDPAHDYLGDIIVNVDQAKRQAKDFDNDLEHEIAELVAHGVLHLLGVHHPDDDETSVHGVKTK